MESVLVDRLASQIWRLLRAPVFEAAIIKAKCADVENYRGEAQDYMGEALMDDARSGDALGKLCRYEAALMNGYTKTLQMLLTLQSHRAEGNDVHSLIEALPPPPNPENGASQ
jgi:hypothetical protein